jgi:hypothetical protein
MEASNGGGRCGEIASDLSVVLVTVAQLVFFTRYEEYIAWYSRGPDGSVTRLSMLTGDYASWLPFPIAASILVIVASAIMIIYNRYWFRQAAWIAFCLAGISVVVSLASIFPFDFSVIPNATAARIAPTVLKVFLICMAVFYGIAALYLLVQWLRHAASQRSSLR